ncbi:MAG TPA: 3-deoxy-D-manno-octulosonic acid transferase [Candidatus Polarisedimenticolia bacterium]|nr:3-deoxy-D-manno-octulosonic acid transferase [Candidatus Polarisedimenticolia bacterium]
MYGLYGALLRLAWAFALPYQIVIAFVSGRKRPGLAERLGLHGEGATPRPGGLWVHAVSVGEVRLALPLLARLRDLQPGLPLHLTTSTATGRALADQAQGGGSAARPDSTSALPFDLPASMGRLLDRLRPRAVLIVETEIWPNLLRLCDRRSIPVILVNGRISPRAYARYRAVRFFLRRALEAIHLFAMQSEEDAARIRTLGAPPTRVRVTGNLKFDLPLPDVSGAAIRARIGLGADEPLFVAGSTAPGEERPVLEAFRALRGHDPRVRLVLAPRHPERFARAEEALRAAGLTVGTWSRPGTVWDALLVDVVGVLPSIYAAADLVFVGGSLVPRGGQNILEPAALGRPVLFGPHMENFRAAARSLVEGGGGFVARDGPELARIATRLMADPDERARVSDRARRAVEANRGALERTLQAIASTLAPRRDLPRVAPART